MTPSCQTCDKGMASANNTRICRLHGREIEPDSMLSRYVEQHGCKDYAREPGSDDQPWFAGAWCKGRGD